MGRAESLEKAEAQIVGEILASAAEGCLLDPPCLEKPRSVSKVKLDGLQFAAKPKDHDVLVHLSVGRNAAPNPRESGNLLDVGMGE